MVVASLLSFPVFAQSNVAQNNAIGAPESSTDAPVGFDSFRFGMTPDRVSELILASDYLNASPEEDISRVPRTTQRVLSVEGNTFVRDAHFQFDESGLISIILNLNQRALDHFTLYTHLVTRYREPLVLNPRIIEWQFPAVILRVERPLTVKLISRSAIEVRLHQESQAVSEQERTREQFLDLF